MSSDFASIDRQDFDVDASCRHVASLISSCMCIVCIRTTDFNSVAGFHDLAASASLFSLASGLGAAAVGLFTYFDSVTVISVFIKIELDLRRIADQSKGGVGSQD